MPFLEQVRALGPEGRGVSQGAGWAHPRRFGGRGIPAGHRPGGARLSRHQLRRLPLGLRAEPRRGGGTVRPGRSQRRRRPAGGDGRGGRYRSGGQRLRRARAARGTSSCADRPRRPTCWASCCGPSVPIASSGAPTPSGTAHPSRSSTPSARSRSPSRSRRSTATRALTAETKDKILSHNARRVYSVSDTALADAAGSLGASASWVGSASTELRRVMTA